MAKEEKALKEQYFEFIELYARLQNPKEKGYIDLQKLADDLKTMKKTAQDAIVFSEWRGIDEVIEYMKITTGRALLLAPRILKPLGTMITTLREQVNNNEVKEIQDTTDVTMKTIIALKENTNNLLEQIQNMSDDQKKTKVLEFTEQQDFETIGNMVGQLPAKITEILGIVAQTITHH